MRFDLVDLALFVNVHESGSITAGAARSHMTLASASERVRGLEDALGVPLFVRERRGVRVTPAGRALVRHARLVLLQMERLAGEMGDFGRGTRALVRVFCNTSAAGEHLPDILGAFLAAHRGVSIELDERPSDEIADALRDGTCDLGVLSDAADLEGLQALPFRADPLELVVACGHPLAARGAVRLADALGEPFVGLVDGSALQTLVERHARRAGRRPAYRIRVRGFDTVCRLVGAGIGVGIVPRAVAARRARSSGIARVALTDAWAARDLVLCVRDVATLPPATRKLLDALREAPRTTTRPRR